MNISNESLQIQIKVVSPTGLCQQTLGTIRHLLGPIRSRAGCLACRIYQDAECPEEVTLFEEWENELSFVEHVSSSDYRHILEWIELSVEQPEVTVCKKINHDGLKLIKKIRKAQ